VCVCVCVCVRVRVCKYGVENVSKEAYTCKRDLLNTCVELFQETFNQKKRSTKRSIISKETLPAKRPVKQTLYLFAFQVLFVCAVSFCKSSLCLQLKSLSQILLRINFV